MVSKNKFIFRAPALCARMNLRAKKLLLKPFVLSIALLALNCFSSEKSLPETTGTAQITGKVVGPDGSGLPGVLVTTTYNGKTIQTTSTSNGGATGNFSIVIADVERGQGFNLQFTKTSFENASQAAVISLPNLKVDVGNVTMFISGGSEVTSRKILGQVLDNFSYRPLAGANVTTIDSAGFAVVTTTDDAGKFALSSNYFALQSTFAVSVFKSNFITRTDIVVLITAEDNTIRNNPIRLYHKFGSIYAYVSENGLTPGAALDGVSVSVTNSNNQVLTCFTGLGASPSGPYDTGSPLPIGKYCPDLSGIISPFAIPALAATNNSGGIKMQNDFLLLGTRYTVNFSKTSTACTNRTPLTTNCFRPRTTYVDMQLVGDNPISGGSISLSWDAWIHGTVSISDPATSGATSPHTVCSGLWSSNLTCVGDNVTVKLYDAGGTYVSQTTTDASGNFMFQNLLLAPSVTYSLTFERTNAYSRLMGFPAPNAPVTIPIMASGANNAGAVTLKALPPPTHCMMGTVKDYWSDAPVDGATVAVFDGGWRTATTGPAAAAGGFPAIGNGQFIIQGSFGWPATRNGTRTPSSTVVTALATPTSDLAVGMMVSGTGIPSGTTIAAILSANSIQLSSSASVGITDTLTFMPFFPMEISKTGYTGEILINKQTFSFAHNGIQTCPAAPYNIDVQLACSPTDVGPSGGANCKLKNVLYPIGIFANINGSSKYFKYQIKQTYERFLTEKAGLTISARAGDLQWTSVSPQKTYDYDTMYLHLDDTPRILPNVPEGKWSNHVPVNPLPTVCSPTVSSPCSPQANGVLAENVGADSRTAAWDIKNYVYYHFYAAAPGMYTIQTTGSTDTYITLISQTGANLGSDDDSGSGSNAKIGPISLLRNWYYIRVKGKNDNVFGFFDVSVTGPTQAEANYVPMMAASYATNCASNNGNMVLSWYDATGHSMFIAGPGENGGCTVSATLEKHGPVGDIVRGRFAGNLRPVAPAGANAIVTGYPITTPLAPLTGFYNIIRSE